MVAQEEERSEERERERGSWRDSGDVTSAERNLRRFMSYSLLATHRRDDESTRARSWDPQTRSPQRFQPPVVAFAPASTVRHHRGRRYVYRVANRCLLDAHSTVRGGMHHHTRLRGDILMTGGRTRADVEPLGGVSARPSARDRSEASPLLPSSDFDFEYSRGVDLSSKEPSPNRIRITVVAFKDIQLSSYRNTRMLNYFRGVSRFPLCRVNSARAELIYDGKNCANNYCGIIEWNVQIYRRQRSLLDAANVNLLIRRQFPSANSITKSRGGHSIISRRCA